MQKIAVTKLISELVQHGLSEQVAWWLLEKLFQKTKVALILLSELSLSAQDQAQLASWVDQIVQAHKPVQYILGDVSFLGLQILVAPPILIPRPETEEWCAIVIKQLKAGYTKTNYQKIITNNRKTSQIKPGFKILDLCAGTGCIGLALAQALPDSHVYAVDINPQACELIEKNKLTNQINNLAVINFDLNKLNSKILSSSEFNTLHDSSASSSSKFSNSNKVSGFDIITANPPYITELEYSELASNVREWEDPIALVSGTDGLDLIRQIIKLAVQIKIKILYLEIGCLQARAVILLAQAAGFKQIVTHCDMYGKDRMLEMRLI